MIHFFETHSPNSPFVLFGPAHLTMLGVLFGINLALLNFRRVPNARQRRVIRFSLAGILAVNEIAFQAWLIFTGQWNPKWNLPLHLCTLFVWLSVWMLVTKNYAIFEMTYFLGIGAAIQPLLTSEVGAYGFPHYYAFQIFISHGGIITAAFIMAALEGLRPTWSSIGRVAIWGNLYLALVTIINVAMGSNYLYTLHKPQIPTVLDHLGPWPWYLLSMEIIAVVISLILYAPYMIIDWRSTKHLKTK